MLVGAVDCGNLTQSQLPRPVCVVQQTPRSNTHRHHSVKVLQNILLHVIKKATGLTWKLGVTGRIATVGFRQFIFMRHECSKCGIDTIILRRRY